LCVLGAFTKGEVLKAGAAFLVRKAKVGALVHELRENGVKEYAAGPDEAVLAKLPESDIPACLIHHADVLEDDAAGDDVTKNAKDNAGNAVLRNGRVWLARACLQFTVLCCSCVFGVLCVYSCVCFCGV
jgi:hypothetical protein